METEKLKMEWCLLQNQFDSYEKHSLYIKFFSIFVFLLAELLLNNSLFIVLILAVVWLQDAIWKTFQSRIEVRLLQVEQYILEETTDNAFQFNSEYQKNSLSGFSLINEYFSQAIRPTVAFPHVVLVFLLVIKPFTRTLFL